VTLVQVLRDFLNPLLEDIIMQTDTIPELSRFECLTLHYARDFWFICFDLSEEVSWEVVALDGLFLSFL